MPVNKSVICPIVVGRADDLAAIKRLREKAAQGQGQIALISGEAGLGKSRLISESIDAARQLETQVFKGNCFEADRAVPYAPLLDLLRNFYADHAGSDLSPYFGSSASELSKILPELAETIPDIAAAPSLEPEQEKHCLFQALAQFLMEQSKTSAVLMVVEDLHWSDDTSLEFL